MSEIKIATSTLNLPKWVDPVTLIDPQTGRQWFLDPQPGGQKLYHAMSPQPGTNDSNAFRPQANPVAFRNPA